MNGFTIIHLSDLHIGKSNPDHIDLMNLSDTTAERLVSDFEIISKKYSVPFRTDETFIVITGDITDTCKWSQFEHAKYFLQQLQVHFSNKFLNYRILPEHIICIPGNHDIEIPEYKEGFKISDENNIKYRNFKLFFQEITNYSYFSREFKIENPFVNLYVPTPFHIQFIDLNTCMNIACYHNKPKNEAYFNLEPSTLPYFTLDHIRKLEAFINSNDNCFRVALMHHQIEDLASEDICSDSISKEVLHSWLVKNHFKLVLCGHTHKPTGIHTTHLHESNGIWELGTGHSFLQGKVLEEGNFYQIIRIEPSKDNEISLYKRNYSWIIGDPTNITRNRWQAQIPDVEHNKIVVNDLNEIIGKSTYLNYVGIGSSKDWSVIAHCESEKFQNWGVLSPGEQINANLLQMSKKVKGSLFRLKKKEEKVDWEQFTGKSLLFLVDSPHYNPYVRWFLDNYFTYLAGGSVNFEDIRGSSPVKQRIHTLYSKEPITSNKTNDQELFGEFEDYLIVMRLPGIIPVTGVTKVETFDVDENRVIWIIAGIHSKASYAGAMIFTRENLQKFEMSLQKECEGDLPEYFEAVYKTAKTPAKIEDFNLLKLEYFSVLRLKKKIGIADEIPSGITSLFRNKEKWGEIPIDTIHFDPVAGCNFNCQTCIEKEVRSKNLFLSLDKCIRIFCDLRDIGCKYINFYGGEPTLHPNFGELLRVVSYMGYNIFMVTNGSKLGVENIKKSIIKAKNQIHVRLSIDGNTTEEHSLHHGIPDRNIFDTIIRNTCDLVHQGVSITISSLLFNDTISNLPKTIDFWRNKRVTSFALRPITDIHGVNPVLDYSESEKGIINDLIKKYDGFVYAPSWFLNWINKGEYPNIVKTYDKCYSAYYRMAISPFNSKISGKEYKIDDVSLNETANAWVSFCSYRRYDDKFGCEYPTELNDWLRKDRQDSLNLMNPSSDCKEIICCRHDCNKYVEEILSM